MRSRRRIFTVVALAAGLGAGTAAAMPARLASTNRCVLAGARIVAHQGPVSLLERGRNSDWTIQLFSCWNPTGREHLITSQDDATEFSLTHVVFNGRYVAGDAHEFGFGGDSAVNSDEIFSVDARAGRTLQDLTPPGVENTGDVPGSSTSLKALALGDDGVIAYIGSAYRPCPAAIGVVAADRWGHHTLDCPLKGEPVGAQISGLALRGHTLTWKHGGLLHIVWLG